MALSGEGRKEMGGEAPAKRETFLRGREEQRHSQEIRDQAAVILRQGDYRGAVDQLASVAEHFSTDPWFQYDYGVSLVRLGGTDNVVAGIHRLQNAVGLEVASNNEVDVWMRIGLAEGYARSDNYDPAEDQYRRVLDTDPDNEEAAFLVGDDATKIERAWALHEEAQHDAEEGRHIPALIKLEKAIILGGERELAWSVHDKGKVLLDAGHVKEAIIEFQKAANTIPDSTWTHSSLGLALERTENPEALEIARREFMNALDLDPENEEAREGLARLQVVETPPPPRQSEQPTTAADKVEEGRGAALRRRIRDLRRPRD